MLVLQRRNPFAKRSRNLVGIAAAEFATGAITAAVFGQFQVFQQHLNGCTGNLRGLYQWPTGVGDAIHPAVHMVAVWVAGVVLHMPNQNVLPVDYVERSIRSEL